MGYTRIADTRTRIDNPNNSVFVPCLGALQLGRFLGRFKMGWFGVIWGDFMTFYHQKQPFGTFQKKGGVIFRKKKAPARNAHWPKESFQLIPPSDPFIQSKSDQIRLKSIYFIYSFPILFPLRGPIWDPGPSLRAGGRPAGWPGQLATGRPQ